MSESEFINRSILERIDIINTTESQLDKIKKWCYENINEICNNFDEIQNEFENIIIRVPMYNEKMQEKISRLMHVKVNEKSINIIVYLDFSEYEINSIKDLFILYKATNLGIDTMKKIAFNKTTTPTELEIDIDISDYYKEQLNNMPTTFEKELNLDWSIYFYILAYNSFNQESIIRETRTHTKKVQSKKDKRAGKKPKVKLIKQNIIRINTDHIQPPTEEEKREYERHIFGWTVRGHWREYKSGKRVWIKPQIRGDKEQVEGKVYEIN